MPSKSLSILVAVLVLASSWAGHAADRDRFMYWSKTKADSTTYISRDRFLFRVDIPGGRWKAAGNPSYNHVIFKSPDGQDRLIGVFDYGEGLFSKKFYKSGFSEAQAIEEYYRWESAFQLGKSAGASSQVIAKDIEGPAVPNILWSIDGPDIHVYQIAMSRNNHLISIYYHYPTDAKPNEAKEFLLSVYRSVQFVTNEQIDEALRTETNEKQ